MRNFLKYWLPLLIWLGVIFVGSTDLMSAEHTSRFIAPILLWLEPGMAQETIWTILVVVRKCAHLGEYAILAVLLWRALRSASPVLREKISILSGTVLLACTVFAASDEFHQSFVKTRTPSVRDVLLDVTGAVLGLSIGASFAHRCSKKTEPSLRAGSFDAPL
jgi:VanZ family protein